MTERCGGVQLTSRVKITTEGKTRLILQSDCISTFVPLLHALPVWEGLHKRLSVDTAKLEAKLITEEGENDLPYRKTTLILPF